MYQSTTPLFELIGTRSEDDDDAIQSQNAINYLPQRLGRDAALQWVNSLPNNSSPMWIGLPLAAETDRQQTIGLRLVQNLHNLTQSALVPAESASTNAGGIDLLGVGGKIFKGVLKLTERWLGLLQGVKNIEGIKQSAAEATGAMSKSEPNLMPLNRFLHREVAHLCNAITRARSDIEYLR